MVSHPENGSDSPIGSDRDRGRDTLPPTSIGKSAISLSGVNIGNITLPIKTICWGFRQCGLPLRTCVIFFVQASRGQLFKGHAMFSTLLWLRCLQVSVPTLLMRTGK